MSDLIDRQAAIDALGEKPLVWNDLSDFDLGKAAQWSDDVNTIKGLPSAQPDDEEANYWHEKANSYEQTLVKLSQSIAEQPQRIKGRWTKAYDGHDGHVKCVQCFKTYDWDTQAQYYNFCPNCGSDNRGEEDEAD